jgi:helicase required for RNAi-mediated heterochromatin assembly 1
VSLNRDVEAPRYIEDNPLMDLSPLEGINDPSTSNEDDPDRFINVDVLRDFPKNINSGFDTSQMQACEKMITSRVATVQGPPGTGKTFTSVSVLKVLNANLVDDDPAIVVAAQTNHALDQLLNHVLAFEPNILRLGGRSNKANKAILDRTLFNLRTNNSIPGGRAGFRQAQIQGAKCASDLKAVLATLMTDKLLTAETLKAHGLITQSQYKSLYGNSDWEGEDVSGDIAEWLTEDQIMPVPETAPINLGLGLEEGDVEYEEQVEDIGNEFKADFSEEVNNLDDDEGLEGEWLPFLRKFTGRHSHPQTLSDKKIKQKIASWKNMYDIPVGQRGEVYRFLEKEMNKIVLKDLKARLIKYQDYVNAWTVTKVPLLVTLLF